MQGAITAVGDQINGQGAPATTALILFASGRSNGQEAILLLRSKDGGGRFPLAAPMAGDEPYGQLSPQTAHQTLLREEEN